jgi:hypothetical protein
VAPGLDAELTRPADEVAEQLPVPGAALLEAAPLRSLACTLPLELRVLDRLALAKLFPGRKRAHRS